MGTGKQDDVKNPLANALSTALSTEMMDELAKDAGAGLENVRSEDMVVPFLRILQKMSPAADDTSSSYVQGAKVGMLLETGTLALYDEAHVIPCGCRTKIVEWHPVESGGGFVAQHEVGYELNPEFQKDGGNWVTPTGTLLVQTMYVCCLLIQHSGDPMPVVLSFTSSQLKKARTWVTRLNNKKILDPKSGKKFTPPTYEMIWKITTVPEENDKGSWRGYKIDPLQPVDNLELFKAARAAKIMFDRSNGNVAPPAAVTPEEA
jgi:hypothetical protein